MTSGPSIDLGSWLLKNGLTYTTKPYQGGTLFVLMHARSLMPHTDGAFAIQFANGAIFAGCHHDSCGGGKQRWPELRARYEPDVGTRLARLRSSRIKDKLVAEGRIDPDLITGQSEEKDPVEDDADSINEPIRARSQEILRGGDPLSFFLETFGKYHEGDQSVAECLVHSLVSRSIINSKGLHVSITGESGKGKSHAIDTMRTLIPQEYRLEGRVSDKALFYMEDLIPGMVITLDDVRSL